MSIKVINGNCLEMLDQLPEQSVNTCVTSPPYWGLRDYGTAEWIGGDDNCEHTINHYSDNLKPDVDRPFRGNRSACIKCGAIRKDNQLGLEDTPEEYVENMVAVFRKVKRVLRDDGTVWLNLGDSYASQGGAVPEQTLRGNKNIVNSHQLGKDGVGTSRVPPKNLKPKDLVGIPWMVAFALRADGWYLRQDIIWHKPNPMPESVTDRCTKSHEYIFLLTKNKKYYYDNNAIREPHTWEESKPRPSGMERNAQKYRAKVNYGGGGSGFAGHSGSLKADGTSLNHPSGRNKRSVWTITTKPFKGAHFATFPPDLIEPCILAGCPEEVCVKCETPYERKMEVGGYDKEHQRRSGGDADGNYYGESTKDYASAKAQDASETKRRILESMREKKDLGLEKQCDCESNETKAGTVLDPFGGSGTTGLVADRNGRNAILIELNDEYAEMARDRLYNDAPLFVDIE